MLDRILTGLIRMLHGRSLDEAGQSTAEYALVIVAAASIVGLLLMWITKSSGISSIFNGVIGKVLSFL